MAFVAGLAAAFAYPRGVHGPDDARAHVAQSSPGQPGAPGRGGSEGLVQDLAFDLPDEFRSDVSSGRFDERGPVHIQLPTGEGGPDVGEAVAQADAQGDQGPGMLAGGGQRGADHGLGDLYTVTVPAPDLLGVALLPDALIGKLGDQRQLPLRHRGLHARQRDHRIDQLGRRQRRRSGDRLPQPFNPTIEHTS